MLFLLLFPLLLFSCNNKNQDSQYHLGNSLENISVQNDSLLKNVEKRIDEGFIQAFIDNDVDDLNKIRKDLDVIDLPIGIYWQAYIDYNKAIYYLSANSRDKSEAIIDQAIENIKNSPTSSENYALLGTLQNLSITFKSPMKAGFIGGNAKENFQKALELEPQNIRAYLGLATLDFYTPADYGGQKNTEKLANKALELPDQPVKNDYLPAWGRNQVYNILIQYLIKSDRLEEAREIHKESLKIFPNDYTLNLLSKKLK